MLPLFIVEIADNEQRIFMKKLYVRFYSPMLSTVCLILSDKDYAEEVVQETFFCLIEHADMVMNIDMSKLPYFLMAVARNTAVDMQRKLTRNGAHLSFSLDEDSAANAIFDFVPLPEEIYLRKELYQEMGNCISQLSERDKLLLEAKYLLEKDDDAIADEFGISINSVRTVISRARRRAFKIYQRSTNNDV